MCRLDEIVRQNEEVKKEKKITQIRTKLAGDGKVERILDQTRGRSNRNSQRVSPKAKVGRSDYR